MKRTSRNNENERKLAFQNARQTRRCKNRVVGDVGRDLAIQSYSRENQTDASWFKERA